MRRLLRTRSEAFSTVFKVLMSLRAPNECFFLFLLYFFWLFVTPWTLHPLLMIKISSVLSLPRCPASNSRPHDRQHYPGGGRPGCFLHGDEVHHLWGRRQNTQVPHRHDRRHHHPDRRSDIMDLFVFLF